MPEGEGGQGMIPTGATQPIFDHSRPQVAPAGIAMRVPPRADLVMQVHYHKSGKAETDATSVGLYFAKEPVEKELRLFWLLDPSKQGYGNISLALGVKAPTGDDQALDYSYRAGGPVLRPGTSSHGTAIFPARSSTSRPGP